MHKKGTACLAHAVEGLFTFFLFDTKNQTQYPCEQLWTSDNNNLHKYPPVIVILQYIRFQAMGDSFVWMMSSTPLSRVTAALSARISLLTPRG